MEAEASGRVTQAIPHTFVIGEAGVNHNGAPSLAKRLLEVAVEAGCDAVKFQTFRADTLVVPEAAKAAYQRETTEPTETQHAMLKRLELSDDVHRELAAQARQLGIMFLSTPFDEPSADMLEGLGMPIFKIPSGEITNLMLLRHVASKGKPVILSTGMSTENEIALAVAALRDAGTKDLTLLHCVSDYPTRHEDLNLRAMATLTMRFSVPVGLSDHSLGISAPIAATALGATVIEKHFTLDRSLPGPDHRASLEPHELSAMVKAIRETEKALGSPAKRVTPSEEATKLVARRSLVAARDLEAGTVLQDELLRAKRPGTGISPMDIDRIRGKRLRQRITAGSLITWELLG